MIMKNLKAIVANAFATANIYNPTILPHPYFRDCFVIEAAVVCDPDALDAAIEDARQRDVFIQATHSPYEGRSRLDVVVSPEWHMTPPRVPNMVQGDDGIFRDVSPGPSFEDHNRALKAITKIALSLGFVAIETMTIDAVA
jgi:hypothetical protein